jgi:hypothetical protein
LKITFKQQNGANKYQYFLSPICCADLDVK